MVIKIKAEPVVQDEKTIASIIKIKEGLHKNVSREHTVFTLDVDGREYEYTWAENVPMLPFMIELLLDDMGIGSEVSSCEEIMARSAVKEFCLGIMGYSINLFEESISVGRMKEQAWAFYEGYMARSEENTSCDN
jgi:hypothetical protein